MRKGVSWKYVRKSEKIFVAGVRAGGKLVGERLDMFNSNRGLAFRVFWSFKRKINALRIDPSDAEQVTLCGLWQAAHGYDPARGVAFSTFATVCVKRALLELVSDRQREISRWEGVTFHPVNDADAPTRTQDEMRPPDEPDWIDDIEPKDRVIVRRRLAGASWEEVAREFGYSHPTHCQISTKAAYNKMRKAVK